jgi:hypothetical protein
MRSKGGNENMKTPSNQSDAEPLPALYRHRQLGHVMRVEARHRGEMEWLSGRDISTGRHSTVPRFIMVRLSPEEAQRVMD